MVIPLFWSCTSSCSISCCPTDRVSVGRPPKLTLDMPVHCVWLCPYRPIPFLTERARRLRASNRQRWENTIILPRRLLQPPPACSIQESVNNVRIGGQKLSLLIKTQETYTSKDLRSPIKKMPFGYRKGAVNMPTNPPQKWMGKASIGSSTI